MLGFVLGPALGLLAGLLGIHLSIWLQVWLGLLLGVVFIFLPDLEVKQKAAKRRRDFRHAIGSFLDLVAMNLSGGRGVPEALMAASGRRHRLGVLADQGRARRRPGSPARRRGRRWARWARRLGIDELRDLGAALSLVAEDGAKVRESLVARAASLRRASWPTCRARRGSGPSRCWSPSSCCAPASCSSWCSRWWGCWVSETDVAKRSWRRDELGEAASNNPVSSYVRALPRRAPGGAARGLAGPDRGASAVELAVITAMILVVAGPAAGGHQALRARAPEQDHGSRTR